MRTRQFVPGLGVVDKPRPPIEAVDVVQDIQSRGYVGLGLAERIKRRARVLSGCDPHVASELEKYAEELVARAS